jgi:hypothetical protein
VKIGLPPPNAQPTTAETKAEARPPNADDPRPSTFRDIPPFGGIGG